jgi:hypothetical protein
VGIAEKEASEGMNGSFAVGYLGSSSKGIESRGAANRDAGAGEVKKTRFRLPDSADISYYTEPRQQRTLTLASQPRGTFMLALLPAIEDVRRSN